MKIGDRVIVRRAFRSRGVAAKSGGWKWEDRTGTITSINAKIVWVRVDAALWRLERIEKYPIDRVRRIEE